MPLPQMVKINNFFGQYFLGDCFEKPLWSLYPCHQTIAMKEQYGSSSTWIINLRSNVGFIKTWGELTWFYFWRYSAVACHKLSHFNMWVFILDFTWNSCRLQETRKLSRNPGQSKCITRETRYQVSIAELLIRNLRNS